MKKLIVLFLSILILTGCVVYSGPGKHPEKLRKGARVKVEILKAPDEEGVVYERKGDSIKVFFDRPPLEQDFEWYSVHDDRLQAQDKVLSILAGMASIISGTFIVVTSLATIISPFLLLFWF